MLKNNMWVIMACNSHKNAEILIALDSFDTEIEKQPVKLFNHYATQIETFILMGKSGDYMVKRNLNFEEMAIFLYNENTKELILKKIFIHLENDP